eukprot:752063-Hanusia_phi.AAC.1
MQTSGFPEWPRRSARTSETGPGPGIQVKLATGARRQCGGQPVTADSIQCYPPRAFRGRAPPPPGCQACQAGAAAAAPGPPGRSELDWPGIENPGRGRAVLGLPIAGPGH